jgi:hypothetical protein
LFLKTQSANHLYEIYDSLGITEKADFYSRFLTENTPPEFGTKADEWRFTNMFQDYLQQKHQQDLASEYQKKRHDVAMILIVAAVLVTIIAVVLMIRHRRKLLSLTKTVNTEWYNAFIGEPVCKFILNTAHEQQFKAKMDCLVYKEYALNKEQLLSLRMAADKHLNGFTERLMKKYPELTNDDINYCLLYLLGLKEPDIAAFMQKAYSTVSDRNRKLKKIFGSTPNIMTFLQKLTFTVIAMFLSLALNAQVSVWDGTAEIWTHGSGTQEDPYLIESAQNLAYLAERTNETLYGQHGNMYVDTCFMLTVDIDFGGSNGLQWTPIGAKGATLGLGTRSFGGRFDGGNHSLSNIVFTNDVLYFGLFGYVKDGEIKNLIVDDDNIIVSSSSPHEMYGQRGLLIGYGYNVTVENCKNYANFTMNSLYMNNVTASIGGLFGVMEGSIITDCHNCGDLTIGYVSTSYNNIYFGGISGVCNNCEVICCSNSGVLQINNCSVHQGDMLATGGIIGMLNGEISNSYCVADINTNSYYSAITCSGGIVGHVPDSSQITATNCYFVGEIVADSIAGIIGQANDNVAIDNCYYINAIESINDYGVPKSESEMKTQEFVDLLNNGGDVYAMDLLNVNNGFPVFSRYTSVVENHSQDNVSVYPNPAKDLIRIEFSDNSACQSVEIYSIDGRLVETFPETSQQTTIDISGLNAGIYIMKVKISNGKECNEKVYKIL